MPARFLRLGALLGCLAAIASAQPPQAAKPPDRAAADFYRWYLAQLAQNHDPVTDTTHPLRAYVAAPLLREIDRRLHSPDGMDADYFIQAQDYMDDWRKNVTTSETTVQAAIATTVVTLGERRDSLYRLRVQLINDAGTWKLRRVARLRGP